MRWSKIKNIIILLLVIVNVSLLAMVGMQRWQSEQHQRETQARLVAILARNDIAFLPQEVPGALDLTPRQVELLPPGQDQAALLVGEITGVQTAGARTTYTGPNGQAVCSASGELEAELVPGSFPLDGRDPGAAGVELLAALGFDAEETARQTEGERVEVTFCQRWDGVPLPAWTAQLAWERGALSGLTLRRLAGNETPITAQGGTIDAATALARFLEALNREGYVCSQVTAVYPGYATSGTSPVALSPAWFVETDGTPGRFAVDASTGTVTAME